MHMSDALVNPTVAVGMYVCSAVVTGFSVKKLNPSHEDSIMANMGIMGAFIFAAQMINFSIPGTGSSGHITGSILLTAILGPYAAFLTMIGVLLIQSLLFADGGLLALGCNIWNMAFYGVLCAGLFFNFMFKNGNINKKRIALASIISSILALQLGAFSVTIETLASGIIDLPFHVFVSVMQPIHLVIGLVEGLITAAILYFVYQSRPQLLWMTKERTTDKKHVIENWKILAGFIIISLVLGGVVSQFASSNPDGLEWSVEKTNPDFVEKTESSIQLLIHKIQHFFAIFPDYNFKGGDKPEGTSISGIIGGLVILFAFTFLGMLTKKLIQRKR